jgi:hypothetical protein
MTRVVLADMLCRGGASSTAGAGRRRRRLAGEAGAGRRRAVVLGSLRDVSQADYLPSKRFIHAMVAS